MEDLRQRHGNHTWDMIVDYHACPQCGYVMENRQKYSCRANECRLDLKCPRCQHLFAVIKKKPKTYLLGHDPRFEEIK